MSDKTITISVSGPAGAGAPTISYLIADFLSHSGFETNIELANPNEIDLIESELGEQLKYIRDNSVKINVVHTQSSRV